MTRLLQCVVFWGLVLIFQYAEGFLQSGLDLRDVHCKDNLEYLNDNICCLNCPAGTRLIAPCTTAGVKGRCEECDDGTFTEHANNLHRCFKCARCQSDQDVVRACTHTHNTECQCKAGKFCDPDQACEMCKTCLRCEKDEEIVRNCTSTANTECKKILPKSDSSTAAAWAIPLLVLLLLIAIAVLAVFMWRRRERASPRNLPRALKSGQHYSDNCPTEDRINGEPSRLSCSSLSLPRQLVRVKSSVHKEEERKVLCESFNSSASNSQHSLTSLPAYAMPAPPSQASPLVPRQPNRREVDQFPKLVPVNGEESLRKCFEYFEEMDIEYHKRFFRHIDITENMIKSKEDLNHADRIHALLNFWIEKEGKDASLNDLLKALVALNQKRTAETIMEKAVHHGHYLSG